MNNFTNFTRTIPFDFIREQTMHFPTNPREIPDQISWTRLNSLCTIKVDLSSRIPAVRVPLKWN